MGVKTAFALLTGIALFLFGMSAMGDGLKKVAGSKLEVILYRLTSTPLKGVILGTGVTAVIQSSSATSVMVVGFVNSGMMKVKQAIGIIMGSILGTSITGWILCLSSINGAGSLAQILSTATLVCIVAVAGIILKMFTKSVVKHHLGEILLGFSVLMTGMSMMTDAVKGSGVDFGGIITKFSNPFLMILIGCLITAVLQSASAAVGILQALALAGGISFDAVFPLLLGIAIGASVPVLLSAIGTNVHGKRTSFIYLFVNLFGVIIVGSLFYIINAIRPFEFMSYEMNAVLIALVNTLFRLITIVLLFPLIGLIEKLVDIMFKATDDDDEEMAEIDRLEDRFIIHPALALEQSRLAMASMVRKTVKNLVRAFSLMDSYSEEEYNTIQAKESVIDKYEDKLGTYLVKINEKELTPEQNIEISKFLHTISDVERIADHAVNLSRVAQEIYTKKLVFSDDARSEISVIKSALNEIVDTTMDAFVNDNIELAFKVEPFEDVIDDLCNEVKTHHVNRVQSGDCTLGQGFVFNDILSNFERIADHCSNIAVAIIELNINSFDTHEYLNALKDKRPEAFSRYFEEYSTKYSL